MKSNLRCGGFGKPDLGVGINSGTATIGNMGCDRKLDYTAVGDTVNLAARLQDMTKELKATHPAPGLLLITEKTLKLSSLSVPTTLWGKIPIRGRQTAEVLHFMTDDDARQCLSGTAQTKLAS